MRTKIVPTSQLKENEIKIMFDLMCQYYEKVSEQTFRADLFEKQKAILLLGPAGEIQGFSTILQSSMKTRGEDFIALYSGDTVLNREYWGNGALAMAFGRYLMHVKLQNPFTNVYWFLISKGYKTYLLMTNNFPTHFPRYEKATPKSYEEVMDTFYMSRFDSCYSANEKLIRFDKNKSSYLKSYVAEIAEELRKNPRIAYFEKKNPEWAQGVELACIAKVSFWIPLRYVLKRILKFFKPRILSSLGAKPKAL